MSITNEFYSWKCPSVHLNAKRYGRNFSDASTDTVQDKCLFFREYSLQQWVSRQWVSRKWVSRIWLAWSDALSVRLQNSYMYIKVFIIPLSFSTNLIQLNIWSLNHSVNLFFYNFSSLLFSMFKHFIYIISNRFATMGYNRPCFISYSSMYFWINSLCSFK